MRLLKKTKDGGPESPVDAYFLIEIKWLFSIAMLKFNKGSRENYHSHAFNALTWFLSGALLEKRPGSPSKSYTRSFLPKVTPRELMHKVYAYEDSWCLTLRGPWCKWWKEYNEETGEVTILGKHREVLHVRRSEV